MLSKTSTTAQDTTQPWTINGKPATQAEVARIENANRRAERSEKTRATAAYEPKAFSLLK